MKGVCGLFIVGALAAYPATASHLRSVKGEAGDGCVCTRELELNCGIDNITYSNHCERRCKGMPLKHQGPCTEEEMKNAGVVNPTALPQIEEPYVDFLGPAPTSDDSVPPTEGASGVEDDNRRQLLDALKTEEDKRKEEELRNTKEGEEASEKEGENGEETKKKEETDSRRGRHTGPPPKRVVCPCPKNLKPSCGDDGVTYANPCTRECAGAKLKHDGPCSKSE
ncbi:kazal-type serine protease inhibitor domain-containing protein [Cystoisospora suis]|uniref:Kazal-type serine protease inhibitor domain-containing protein n=1 Tax=Cystoisospora suis TaxID=483139 RepID=A0A2C6KEZ9_9APIC|nr:kazal-type serine protease inhibitor domain-containing protein [Cystoisospora suis]